MAEDQEKPLNFSLRHLTEPDKTSPSGQDPVSPVGMGFAEDPSGSPKIESASPSRESGGDRQSSSPEGSPDPQISAALSAMFSSTSPFLNNGLRMPPSNYNQLFGGSVPFFNQASYMQSIAAMSAAVNAYNQKNGCINDGTTISVNSFNASSPRSRSPTPISSSGAQLSCAVCGDVSSGKHYGILACNGCSGFFKRSVRRRLIYRCQAGTGQCVVDKAHRNQCQACRLKKCLAKGMNKDAVQNERQPRNTATIQNPVEADFYNSNFLQECPNVLSTTVDLNNVNFDLNAKCRRGSLETELKELSANTNPEVSSRLLFMAVKWAKALPSFAQLQSQDQATLLDNAWPELFLLSAFQWSMEMDKCPLFEGTSQSALIKPLINLFELFKARSPDPAELACLKALVLFRSDTRGLRSSSQIERLQDQAQAMLQQHSCNKDPNAHRFGKLLLLLPPLRTASVPKLIEKVFLDGALNGKSVGSVISDIGK
ncbi:unnamed protein product [Bursaphelenchus xylophilus]|uniref:(pine wood nematode) hypothetical protein n=1 Tax=Bursaphelenchus xylophilus TaxID=6326 RepID=A0A1I7RRD0_BURXY|nr:unnamed protein product [Bursaphelenchus xylophilus]CAG9130950.1 unnamed protein product [Bursaphelenchus xylophilus]